MSGSRLDLACLDQVYGANSDWFSHVQCLECDGRQTLSDHWPVVCTLALQEADPSEICKTSYFKYDSSYLDSEDILRNVEGAWGHQEAGENIREFWQAGWRRVGRVMRRGKKLRQAQFSSLDILRDELQHLRIQVGANNAAEEQEYLHTYS
jgi:hypothetical protein